MIKLVFDGSSVDYIADKSQKTPLDYLLISVVLCLGHEIVEINKQDKFRVGVHFGSMKVKIECECREEEQKSFLSVVSRCYILKNLRFEAEVSFTEK